VPRIPGRARWRPPRARCAFGVSFRCRSRINDLARCRSAQLRSARAVTPDVEAPGRPAAPARDGSVPLRAGPRYHPRRPHDRLPGRPGPRRRCRGRARADPRRGCGRRPAHGRFRLPGRPRGVERADRRDPRPGLPILRVRRQPRRGELLRAGRLPGAPGGAHGPPGHPLAGRPRRALVLPLRGHSLRADGARILRQRGRGLRALHPRRPRRGRLLLEHLRLAQEHAADAGRREVRRDGLGRLRGVEAGRRDHRHRARALVLADPSAGELPGAGGREHRSAPRARGGRPRDARGRGPQLRVRVGPRRAEHPRPGA